MKPLEVAITDNRFDDDMQHLAIAGLPDHAAIGRAIQLSTSPPRSPCRTLRSVRSAPLRGPRHQRPVGNNAVNVARVTLDFRHIEDLHSVVFLSTAAHQQTPQPQMPPSRIARPTDPPKQSPHRLTFSYGSSRSRDPGIARATKTLVQPAGFRCPFAASGD